nr:MAG TPA: hypothetical protein [Caudoviricetes sp.]
MWMLFAITSPSIIPIRRSRSDVDNDWSASMTLSMLVLTLSLVFSSITVSPPSHRQHLSSRFISWKYNNISKKRSQVFLFLRNKFT